MKLSRSLALIFTVSMSLPVQAAPHFCAGQMREAARRLLEFHLGQPQEFERIGPVVEREPVSLDNGLRHDTVLEAMAEVGKMGTYLIRMTYAVIGTTDPKNDCVLVGQEIVSFGGI